ncbi:heat shock protein beta-9 [Ictidomys tridecemlineatus]|uniref:Heat shock protein beta-9 n=1 Tax=Ictidomys tridecemlineatus TaxID=43179 RepID=I3M869_ICTTR|nr:heat shock protein beta-9 [Ictidomys tridecemlineatus]KAG3268926.1 heat shock protein family B (small) member 9 [Ictidomys tridecemlineatus]KAG3268927.1 HSPB9 [Ictidomys tridecemlineatus]
MQQVGNSFSNQSPSVALAESNPVATLPVRLLRDDQVAVQGSDHAKSFQMKMNAHGFTPEELVVQVDGRNLMVTGQRQIESTDPVRGGYRMEQKVHRQMQLPPGLDTTAMTCCLTPSGQLWVQGQTQSPHPPEALTGSSSFRSRGSKKGST